MKSPVKNFYKSSHNAIDKNNHNQYSNEPDMVELLTTV